MADVADAVQKLINSPPGQLAAGGVLAGIVWKFFERVEAVLAEQTKFEIAVWLVGVQIQKNVAPWANTFATVFDRVFGLKHLSLRCFWRSCLASTASVLLVAALISLLVGHWMFVLVGLLFLPVAVVPDYISLLKTRRLISAFARTQSLGTHAGILLLDFTVGVLLAFLFPLALASAVYLLFGPEESGNLQWDGETYATAFFALALPNLGASLFTSIWLWLYAGSGFILKAARRFDLSFGWFNRKFDIEKKPLQAIGLVAGSLVSIVYWGFVLCAHVVSK
jgi:hypothetical protein